MVFGLCPNCFNKLTEDSSLVTEPSSIFKGNNVYMLCKNCQQVLLYNKDRDMVFDLDDFKDDDAVLEEINMLLEKINSDYEVVAPSNNCEGNCEGNCAACTRCQPEPEYQRRTSRVKQAAPVEEETEPVAELEPAMINDVLDYGFLAVNKLDPSKKQIVLEEDLNLLKVDEWIFFELTPVTIKAITTYEIVRQ